MSDTRLVSRVWSSEHRAACGALLLATQTFWQGVDVPGESLSLVMIDKLPFQVPDDPLVAPRRERIAADGRDPFRDHQLPTAVLALRQGFGRLTRSGTDRGACPAVSTAEAVEAFFAAPLSVRA